MNYCVKIAVAGLAIGMIAGAMLTESDTNVRKLVAKGRECMESGIKKLANK